jgi:multiple sugar transport system permease protein
MLGSVPLGVLCALALALALNQKIRGITFYRTIYFIPVVSSMIAVALMWRWMYNPTSGILNYILNSVFDFFHLPFSAPEWLQSTRWAMPAIILMSVWKGLGYNMVLFLAGLQGIPTHLYEAAEIDGASSFKKFLHITLPLLTPTTFFIVIIAIIGSFQVFEQAYIMTQGGPARATVTTVYHIYENGFQWYKMGYASAIAWVLFALILVVTLVQWKYQDRWVFYE